MRLKLFLALIMLASSVVAFCLAGSGGAASSSSGVGKRGVGPEMANKEVRTDDRKAATQAEAIDYTRWERERQGTAFEAGQPAVHAPAAETATIETTAPSPVALTDPDAEMNLSPLAVEGVEKLREEFVQKLRAGPRNPEDPAYLARWLEAQRESDDRLRVVIGAQAFMRLHDKSAREAAEAAGRN
jgi:hypothetical protein